MSLCNRLSLSQICPKGRYVVTSWWREVADMKATVLSTTLVWTAHLYHPTTLLTNTTSTHSMATRGHCRFPCLLQPQWQTDCSYADESMRSAFADRLFERLQQTEFVKHDQRWDASVFVVILFYCFSWSVRLRQDLTTIFELLQLFTESLSSVFHAVNIIDQNIFSEFF